MFIFATFLLISANSLIGVVKANLLTVEVQIVRDPTNQPPVTLSFDDALSEYTSVLQKPILVIPWTTFCSKAVSAYEGKIVTEDLRIVNGHLTSGGTVDAIQTSYTSYLNSDITCRRFANYGKVQFPGKEEFCRNTWTEVHRLIFFSESSSVNTQTLVNLIRILVRIQSIP